MSPRNLLALLSVLALGGFVGDREPPARMRDAPRSLFGEPAPEPQRAPAPLGPADSIPATPEWKGRSKGTRRSRKAARS